MSTSLKSRLKRHGLRVGVSALALAMTPVVNALELGGGWNLHGWARQYLSWNADRVQKPDPRGHYEYDRWDLSMNRQSLYFDVQGPTGELNWVIRTRFSNDELTKYEKSLQRWTKFYGAPADFRKEYREADVRELFFDWAPNDRLAFRIGRQQVVWGETDFFHATDVIHGFDLRWRKFLNASSEEVRKPLIMINTEINFPTVDGSLQLLLRPGLDDATQLGNDDPTFGGRWSNAMAKGINLASIEHGGIAKNNFDFKGHGVDADSKDPHYGFRWKGESLFGKPITYAFSYYHGVGGGFQDPILITDFDHPKHGNPLQFILPETDTVGASISGFIPSIDAVYRAEIAYTPDRPMSRLANDGSLPIVKEDMFNYVFGLDMNPRLQDVLGTSNASLLSIQIFDWHIPDADKKDRVIRFDGSGYYKTHNVIGTVVFSNPFMGDNLNATLVLMHDFTYKGGMIIPSVEYQYQANWRFKLEYDHAFGGETTRMVGGFPPDDASIFGALKDDDQLVLYITYQF